MVLRSVYAPVLPKMNSFLFACSGEVDGMPLSLLSALARLGLDPRDEAARLSCLTSEAAADQLAGIIARLPDLPWTSTELRKIARRLIELLPSVTKGGENDEVTSHANRNLSSRA